MAETSPPFWQIKLSSKGQITLPTDVIARLGLVSGVDYLYLFLDQRVIEVVTYKEFPETLARHGDLVTPKEASRSDSKKKRRTANT